MKQIFFYLTVALTCTSIAAQKANSTPNAEPYTTPKLVVGIVVDQMRYDYLTRFWDGYTEGGFKRMVLDGFNCKNNHYNYAPTYTGPGHASIHTGASPSVHGIIGNNWYDKEIDKSVYCAGDNSYASVGTEASAGKMSPHRMKVTTVADQNRLHTQMRGKTIGISIKDRGAILPAGHTANAAYWFQGKEEGNWISSTFYMEKLPKWVVKFNNSKKAESYMRPWNTLRDIKTYVESGPDDNPYEGVHRGEKSPVFPHRLKKLSKFNGGYDILKGTPFGNSLTTDFALAAIEGEQLGKDNHTDFLNVSYSSTDYVGHKFGVNSKEVQDTYLRLDQDIARLLTYLDKHLGQGEYTVFLTADHGAVHVPSFLQSVKVPSGYLDSSGNKDKFTAFLKSEFGNEAILKNVSNNQVFLDHGIIDSLGLTVRAVQEKIAAEVLTYDHINRVYTAYDLSRGTMTDKLSRKIQNGFNQRRSGDVMYVLDPAVISYSKTGSTHGSDLNYDTHVPLLFYGKGINKGETTELTEITDVAPTISALLGIAFPNGAIGQPISKVID